MDARLVALNRFGMGARIGEPVRLSDPRGWLVAQLDAPKPSLPVPSELSPRAIADALRALRAATRSDEEERRAARQRLLRIVTMETRIALDSRIASEHPFVERWTAFWSNHLCVSAGAKVLVAPLAGSYEREVVRPHVFGRFEDMVLASARHPAMLVYLDNFQSIGPNSAAARPSRRATGRGLNENYARELLELHTLGVDGGYSQNDVQELARILTGWTVSGLAGPATRGSRGEDDAPLGFAFRDLLHEPGAKTLLGSRIAESGAGEGEAAIRMLCRHPATARHIALKIATHFTDDAPPGAATARIERAFLDSDGDLRVTARALIECPEAWAADAHKFRTPQDWLVAAIRAVGGSEANDAFGPLLRQLRQPLWSPPSPRGFPDLRRDWADPDALLNRAELSRTLARRIGGMRTDPASLVQVIGPGAGDPLRALLDDPAIPADERIALALAGPAFQWR
jgi:uncharacterized protein (DUF1800 family)